MTIKRRGKSFYLEVFNPTPCWKFLGKIIVINHPSINGEVTCFVTHFKQPEIHFYIKNLGYPVNEELLKMLVNASIKYILIPEQGKRGFKAYIGTIKDYLEGELIHEPLTEKQRSIPLKNLDEIGIDEKKLIETMHY